MLVNNNYNNQYNYSKPVFTPNLQAPDTLFTSNSYQQDYTEFEEYSFPENMEEVQEINFWDKVSNTVSELYGSVKNGIKKLFGYQTDLSVFNDENSVSGILSKGQNLKPLNFNPGTIVSTGYKDASGRIIKLNTEAAACFDQLMKIAKQNGVSVRVSSSFRDVDHQARLWKEALKKYGSESAARKWVAPPGKSQHNYGNAIDLSLYKNGKKLSQSEFDRLIGMAGFYRPMSHEGWHIEPISTKHKRKEMIHFH